MNRGNRHAQYRQKLRRKRKIRRIIILCGILLLLLAVGFLILGTLSAKRSNVPPNAETNPNGEEQSPIQSVSVKAYPLYLETKDATSLAGRLQELRKQSVTDASVPLNQSDGSLLYSSSLAGRLGVDTSDYSITVQKAAAQAKNYKVQLHGLWHVTAFEEKDALIRSVRLAETASLLADALKNGMKDILLLAPEVRTDSLEELLLLSESVHRLYPDGTVGLCIPSSFLESEDLAILVDDLVTHFDFLAIDSTDVPSDEASRKMIHSLLLRDEYNTRLLFPYSEDSDEQRTVITTAEQYGVKRWQILP